MTSFVTHQRTNWALLKLLQELWARWREGWQQIPQGGARRFFVTVIVGSILAAALVAGLTFWAKSMDQQGNLAWERNSLLRMQDELPISFYQAGEMGTLGGSLLLWPLMIIAAGIAIWFRRPLPAISFVAGYALVSATVVLGWKLWARSRPDFIAGGLGAPGFHSFPSGHVAHIPVAYGLMVWWWIRQSGSWFERMLVGLIVPIVVVVVTIARLRTGAHWPSDIAAGMIVGFAWLVIMVIAVKRGERGR